MEDKKKLEDMTAREILEAEKDLLQQYTLEELEANPDLLYMIPEERREEFLQKQRQLKIKLDQFKDEFIKIRTSLKSAWDQMQPLYEIWEKIKQDAQEKYNISDEELDELLIQDKEINSVSWGEFLQQSATSEGDLLIGGLLYSILERSRKENRPVEEVFQEALEAPGVSLKQFLKDTNAFMVAPLPRGMDKFMSINKTVHENTEKEFPAGVKIGYSGRLGINEQKINGLIRMSFSNANYYAAKKGLNAYVELPFLETMRILKKKPTEANIKKFRQRLIKEILPSIAHQYIEIKDKNDVWHRMEIGGGYISVDRKNDRIIFRVSDSYALYLSTAPLTQYSSKTFELGDQNNPLPFYLAMKLQDHYFHDGNRARATNTILSIKKLLEFCEDTIPSYDYIQSNDPGHWVREIKHRLEGALNDIQKGGLFKWEYCKKGLAPVSKKETQTKDYHEWKNLYITFTLIPEEPDQTNRLLHKQERLEDEQKKQAIKEAEKIIKADRIQKKKVKRGQANPRQGTTEPEAGDN